MTALQIRQHDLPIGQARGGAITLVETRAASPRETWKRSDTDQMNWHQLCLSLGINPSTFWYRINRYGMTPLQALTSPIEPYNHVVMAVSDLCERVGLERWTFYARRRRGWSFREALLTPVRPRRQTTTILLEEAA